MRDRVVDGDKGRGKVTHPWGLKFCFSLGKCKLFQQVRELIPQNWKLTFYLLSNYLTKTVRKVILQELSLNKMFTVFAWILNRKLSP